MLRRRRREDPAAAVRRRCRKGRQVVERRLRRLERRGWTVLRDQAVPGSDRTVDYLAIGRSGVWCITVRPWEPLYPVAFDGIKAYCGLSLSSDIRRVCAVAGAVSTALEGAFGGPVWVGAVMAVQENPINGGWMAVEVSPTTVLEVPAWSLSWRLRRLRAEWSVADVTALAKAARTVFAPTTG